MPVSPYYGQSGYVNRSYARSSSSSSIPLLDSVYGGSKYSSAENRGTATERENNFASYFRSKYIIPEDGPASSYLIPRYKTGAPSGYQLKRYGSTDSVPDTRGSVENSKLKKSPSTSNFLTGNTTSFMKSFNTPETVSSNTLYTASRPKNFDYNLPTAREDKILKQKEPMVRKFAGKSGGQSSYVNQYLARINQGKDVKPREIDTRDINTSEKPRTAKWLKPDTNNEDEGLISRNRQVVRLTIKREKEEPEDPFLIKNKTLQTIAQRLMDKYRLPEKKPVPSVKEPTRRVNQDANPPKDKPPLLASAARPPILSSATVSRTAASVAPQDPLTFQTSSKDSPEDSGAIKSTPSSCEEEKSDDAAKRLLRATNAAESKKELESWEEVQDAIYAAVLSPDVDLESDEEMEKLVKGDAGTPDGLSSQGKDGSEEGTRASTGDGKGRAIVGQLKRFVKQQESVKGPSKKRSSAKNSRKSKNSRKGQEDQTGDSDVVDKILISRTRNEKEKASLLIPDLVTDDAKNEKNKIKEKTRNTDTCNANKDSSKGISDVNDPVKTEGVEKQESVQDTMVKLSRFTSPPDRPTKTDECSLSSVGLELHNATPQAETQIKSKASTAHQTEPENRISHVEKVEPKPVNDEKEQSKFSSKAVKKDKSSLLSSDLVFNVVTSDDKKKTQMKALPPTGQKKTENRKSELEESNRRSKRDVKELVKEKLCTKPEKTVESSILSADLVLTSLTSDEKQTKPTKQKPEKKVSELEESNSKPPSDEKEQTKVKVSTKIPKLKKKKKEVEESSPELIVPRASPVTPPLGSISQEQSASEKVSKSQALPPSEVSTEINKKSSNRTSATRKAIETSSHQQHSTTPVHLKLSVSRKEDECAGSEEASAGEAKCRVTLTKRSTDVSVLLGTSKKPTGLCFTQSSKSEKAVEVESSEDSKDADKDLKETYPVLTISKFDEKEELKDGGTQRSKDEKAVEMECSKTNKNADKDPKGTYPVLTVSKCDEKEKLEDGGTQEQSIEKLRETKEGEKQNILLSDKSKPPEENHVSKTGEKKMEDSTVKASSIPRKIIEAVSPTQEKNLIGLKEIQKEVEDSAKHEEKAEKTTEKIEEGKEKRNNIRQECHRETLNGNEVLDSQTSPDALQMKKPLRRPRQIVPPPEPQKTIGNEFLNARNVLKRPNKQIPVMSTNNKEEQTTATVGAPKKVWKRPTAPLVPPNQGDLFLQARGALKKPLKPKDGKTEKKDEIAEAKPKDDVKTGKKEEKVPETRFKKFVKKPVASSQPDEVGESEPGTRGRALKKQKHTRSRSASSSSSSSYDGSTVRKKIEKPKRLMKPRPVGAEKTPSPKLLSPVSPRLSPISPKQSSVSPKHSSVSPKLSPVPSIPQEPEEPSPSVEKAPADSGRDKLATSTKETTGSIGQDPKLSACQSADSGYGSSPSTPQPTPTAADVKDEEVCTVCGTNCHKKCEKQMPNLCGVNQKLLAEALSSVKKGGSTDGTTRTLASPTKASSSVSGSETETTEDETESTDTDSDFFGPPEIRAPIQTCLKFKKYTVDDFNFIKVLGKGSYGKVMLAQQKDSENYFAVKCLKKDVVLEDNDIECTLIERKVLSLGTKHPYLCHLFCTFQTPSHLFFVMEYLTGGDLMFHIQHCGRFDEFRACFYAAEITSGLKFLHSKGIIYRDLKLDNILLDYQGHIRIADFGMCKLQVYLDRYADTFCGTPDYMAPEVIKGLHYNQCVDWWSFGVLLYEMLTGKSPFKGCDEDHLFWLICNDEPFFPKFLSKEATQILKQLLDKDSTRRLGIPFSPYGEITVHPFFKYIDWHKIERKEVETPYKPRLRHILDVQYFDPLFTKRHAAITPLDESILTTMDQTAFRDFSYTNPNITD